MKGVKVEAIHIFRKPLTSDLILDVGQAGRYDDWTISKADICRNCLFGNVL